MNIMTRRRIMMAGIALPEWDYEWDYTDGLPENNGWLKATSGTASSSIQSDYLKMQAESPYSYIAYRNPDLYNRSSGVMEAVVAVTIPSSRSSGYTRLCFGNGTKGIQIIIHAPDKTIKLYNNTTVSNGTTIKSGITSNTYYTIRLVLDDGYGYVYVDGELVASQVDIQTIQYSSNTSFWHQASTNANTYTRMKSVKLKLGRAS